eukprot:s154_g38.t1
MALSWGGKARLGASPHESLRAVPSLCEGSPREANQWMCWLFGVARLSREVREIPAKTVGPAWGPCPWLKKF